VNVQGYVIQLESRLPPAAFQKAKVVRHVLNHIHDQQEVEEGIRTQQVLQVKVKLVVFSLFCTGDCFRSYIKPMALYVPGQRLAQFCKDRSNPAPDLSHRLDLQWVLLKHQPDLRGFPRRILLVPRRILL